MSEQSKLTKLKYSVYAIYSLIVLVPVFAAISLYNFAIAGTGSTGDNSLQAKICIILGAGFLFWSLLDAMFCYLICNTKIKKLYKLISSSIVSLVMWIPLILYSVNEMLHNEANEVKLISEILFFSVIVIFILSIVGGYLSNECKTEKNNEKSELY